MSDETEIQAAAQTVGEATATIAQAAGEAAATAASAEAAIEAAAEKVEAAEAVRDAVAEAALRDALGKMVHDLQTEFTEWREEKRDEIAELQETVASLQEQVASLTAAVTTPLPNEPPIVIVPSSTLGNSETPPEGTIINPLQAPAVEAAPVVVVPAAPRRRGHWM